MILITTRSRGRGSALLDPDFAGQKKDRDLEYLPISTVQKNRASVGPAVGIKLDGRKFRGELRLLHLHFLDLDVWRHRIDFLRSLPLRRFAFRLSLFRLDRLHPHL